MKESFLHFNRPRALMKSLGERLGYRISLTRSVGLLSLQIQWARGSSDTLLPALVDDPLEALHLNRGGKPTAFRCSIDECVTVNGLNFSRAGWHPFAAALEELGIGREPAYAGSVLERYYANWQPDNAAAALIDLAVAPDAFAALPSHLIYLFPWSARSVTETTRAVQKWTQDDHLEHDGPQLTAIEGTVKDHGPLAAEAGHFEYERLLTLYDGLRAEGFCRERGDIRVVIIKRDRELRFLNFGGGLHRTAAMKALGHRYIPAVPLNQLIIDVRDVDYWPQVRNGLWPRHHALRYIDHLFEFDAAGWARNTLGIH